MGLFRKKATDDTQIDHLQAQLEAVQRRLEAADHAKASLEAQVETLNQTNNQLAERLGGIDAANAALNARLGTIDQANTQLASRLGEIDTTSRQLGQRIGSLAETSSLLNARVEIVDDLSARVRELGERVSPHPSTAPPPPPPHSSPSAPPPHSSPTAPPPPPAGRAGGIDDGRLTDMANQIEDLTVAVAAHASQLAAAQERIQEVDELAALLSEGGDTTDDDTESATVERLDEMQAKVAEINDRVGSLDERVTRVSTELANQLTELSTDIDHLHTTAGADDDTEPIDTAELEQRLSERLESAVGDVRDSAERLAAEQARYEIQFREDLASLAERLRRPGN